MRNAEAKGRDSNAVMILSEGQREFGTLQHDQATVPKIAEQFRLSLSLFAWSSSIIQNYSYNHQS